MWSPADPESQGSRARRAEQVGAEFPRGLQEMAGGALPADMVIQLALMAGQAEGTVGREERDRGCGVAGVALLV